MQTHALMSVRFPLEFNHPPTDLAIAPENLRILIVNEDMRCADSLKRTLQELGYSTTFTAYSARRALVAAAEFFPAIALIDLELSDMTGYQLASKLRTHLKSSVRQVPLLAIAASDASVNLELTRSAGFIGYLTKPVQPLELKNALCKSQRRRSVS